MRFLNQMHFQGSIKFLFLILSTAVLFVGCDDETRKMLAGRYQGSMTTVEDGKTKQRLVYADIDAGAELGRRTVAVREIKKDSDDEAVSYVDLNVDTNGVAVFVRDVTENWVQLTQIPTNTACYSGTSGYEIKICLAGEEVSVEISDDTKVIYSLAMTKFTSTKVPKWEEPSSVSLTDVVQRATDFNYSTKIEFQHVMQARLQSKNAYMNLLPHLSNNSIGVLYGAYTGGTLNPFYKSNWTQYAFGPIGDLTPFLLPSRWIQAENISLASKAEKQALAIMRLDTAVQAETMVYNIVRDKSIMGTLKKIIETATKLRDQLRIREKFGQLPKGVSDDMDAIVLSSKQDLEALDLFVQEEKHALAQALGYFNPNAISDVAVPMADPLEIIKAVAYDKDDAYQTALDRSFEVKQLNYLISAAENGVIERFFDFIDPAGDPASGLGLGLPSYVSIGKSQVRELKIRREQAMTNISQKVGDAISEYESGKKLVRISYDSVLVNQRRLTRMVDQTHFGTIYDMFGLFQVFKDYTSSSVNLANAITGFKLSKVKLNRALLGEHYANPLFLKSLEGNPTNQMETKSPFDFKLPRLNIPGLNIPGLN